MKETEKFQKRYGGPTKCLYLSIVGRRAFNVQNHCLIQLVSSKPNISEL